MPSEDILDSWKEIAAYLKRDVRTCQRWEKEYSLPVHRLDGSPKARVFAFSHELDRWLESTQTASKLPGRAAFLPLSRPVWIALASGVIFIALAILTLTIFFQSSPVPADFHIQGSKLVILNSRNKPLWEYETGLENLESEDTYRNHFQNRRSTFVNQQTGWAMPFLMIKDIDGDRVRGVLSSVSP